MQNLSCYNEYFVLSLTVSKNDMMIQMVDKRNASLIGQERETLTFKALLYLNVAVHVQVCRVFCVAYIPLLSLVQLGYPAITNFFVVNQIIRYNEDPAITNIFFGTVTLRYSGVPLYNPSISQLFHPMVRLIPWLIYWKKDREAPIMSTVNYSE